jgi:glycosyltransferase involved in cell wall biosynthesis
LASLEEFRVRRASMQEAAGDENELGAMIATALADDALYERCHERAPEIAEYFSWERTALQLCHVIAQALRSAP